MQNLTIRLERPEDYHAVEQLTRAAFDCPEMLAISHSDFPLEPYLLHQLRKTDGILALDFVAERDGAIVGHIIYSHSYVLRPDGARVPTLTFGPLSVAPALQKTGIGGALVRHSVRAARAQGHGAILIFGHPAYYPRFGFVAAETFGITDRNGGNIPAFMALELVSGYLGTAGGTFHESDAFDDDLIREAARAYDQQLCRN